MPTIDQIASTPGFNAGSVDVQPSNTKVTKITKKIDNLQPGVTYTLLVRAKKNGEFSDYVSYQYTVPETDKSGNNFTVSNSNTDIQLLGGGFAASSTSNPFPINIGKIDITQNTIAGSGTGVIMNQYGIAGFQNGTKQFSLSAINGDAYFAGTLSASSITSGGGALSSDLASYAQVSSLASYATKAGLGSTGYTTIHGGNITTGTIVSSGYVDGTDPYFSSAGTGINLDSGTFRAKQFGIDSSGNVKFAGTITASATIGTTPASTVVANAAAGASALQSIPANYITTSTSISGGQITTGTIKNGAFPGTGSTQATDGSGYSISGMAINLDNSSITSPYFTLSSTGATFKGAITSGSTITGATLKTGSGSSYIQIYDQGYYGEILFKNGALYTEGSIYGATEQILITSPMQSGYTSFSSISLGGESDIVNSNLSLQSGGYYIHLNGITGLDYIGPMVSAGAALTGLRKISVQNGGSASGGADGDIILIY
jgi:hypothetical protein